MNTYVKNTLGILVAIALLVSIIIAGFEIASRARGGVQDITKTPTISMSADGKITAKPDTATLVFSVVTTGAKAETVQKDSDKKMTEVKNYLQSKDISEDDIRTSNYNLFPQYNYNNPDGSPPDITGYTLTQTITVNIRKLDSVSEITGNLTGKGINQIDSVSFYIDDPNALKDQARTEAVGKARAKADDLAKKLGVKLGKVVSFHESDSGIPPFPGPVYYGDAKGYGGGGSSPIQPGSQDVVVTVSITFELK